MTFPKITHKQLVLDSTPREFFLMRHVEHARNAVDLGKLHGARGGAQLYARLARKTAG